MISAKYDKYLVYFYILSFFVLVSLIGIYKKSNKLVICVAIIILCIQLFIVYDTYTILEPAIDQSKVTNIKTAQGNINTMIDVQGQSGKTDLGNVYAEFNNTYNKQINPPTPVLEIIKGIDNGNYTNFDTPNSSSALSKKKISDFSEQNIKDMITKFDTDFKTALNKIKMMTGK